MSTPQTTSPFATGPNSGQQPSMPTGGTIPDFKNVEQQEEYTIHTMQDDLELAKNDPIISETKTNSAPKESASPVASSAEKPAVRENLKTNVQPMAELASKEPIKTNNVPEKAPEINVNSNKIPANLESPWNTPKQEIPNNPFIKPKTSIKSENLLNNSPVSEQETKKIIENSVPSPASKTAATLVEVASNNPNQEKKTTTKILLIIAVTLFILLAGFGGYYWINHTSSQGAPVAITPAPQQEIFTTPENPSVEVPIEKYSQDKPNYLSLDLIHLSSEEIKSQLVQIKNDIANSSSNGALYEFLVVDANNNPVAFPIFATAAKLNMSPDILATLGPDFLLYFFNDNGNVRLAFSAAIQNKQIFSQKLALQEKTFASDATLLFLDSMTDNISDSFASSEYKNFDIRYLNVNATGTLSIDYTTTDSRFFVATSKNTLRAILDMPSQTETKKDAATTTQDSPNSNIVPTSDINNQIPQTTSSTSGVSNTPNTSANTTPNL